MIKYSTKQKIHFYFLVKPFNFPKRNDIKSIINLLFKVEKKKLDSLTYIFCSDVFLLKLNNKFLNHNYFTDIITFDLSEKSDMIVGDIYISIERVKENAKQLNASFKQELRRVIFHGSLHLCGYKDKAKKDIILIRKKEAYYLHMLDNHVSRGTV